MTVNKMNDLSSWDEIRDHLFEVYCVEGQDRELCDLMKKHDEELRIKAIDDCIKIVNRYDDTGIDLYTVSKITDAIVQSLEKEKSRNKGSIGNEIN